MMDNHHAPSMNSRRNRNSILQTAGDALGFRLNKRKRVSTLSSNGQSPSYGDGHSKLGPSIFDDVVLEISANGNGFNPPPTVPEYAEDDSAERERLRDAAAQAVGLPQANSNFYGSPSYPMTNGPSHYGDSTTTMEYTAAPARIQSGKRRSGLTKSTGSLTTTGSALPRYPGTLSSMQSYVQNGANLLKYYSSASPFLILSRSRQWKTRYIVLTSTILQNPRRTSLHLHLFKSGASDDRELERMRIHTNSVVYVADEEVGGGRQFILKIGGIAIDAGSKEVGPASWLLQMPDSAQMQRWIQIVKNAVLLQKAERDGPVTDVYHNIYGNTRQERKSDIDMSSPMKYRQSFTLPPAGLPMANTLDSVDTNSNGAQPNGAPAGLGPVSALKGLWNSRPTSRQLSISGSSIATAFPTPSLNSQPSVHTATNSNNNNLLSPLPLTPASPTETEQGTQETVPSKSRESTLYNIFRPTSPQANMHQQQQPSITHLSPPISPALSLPFTEDTVTSPSSTIGTRFSPNGSARHAHHSSSFSVDWDAIDINGSSLAGVNSKRNNPVIVQPALAPPPPRRRPVTGGGLSLRQPTPPKEAVQEERGLKMSHPPVAAAASMPLQLQPRELEPRRSFDYREENGDITMETALRGQGGQRSYFDDDDDEEDEMHENGTSLEVTVDRPVPLDLSPRSVHSHGQDDHEVESQRSTHLPSPLQRSNLPLSSASSFGASGSVRTAIHEQGSLGMGFGQSSTLSLHSGSRDDSIMEDENRDGAELEGGEPMNQFHLPTGARRRSRLSSIPRQLSPPLGPLPPVPMPMFHSPPFPAVSSPSHEYSSSDRPGSISSIPSTVPSLHTGGMPPLLSKRISTMSTSDAPSIKSIDSSGGGSMSNLKLVGGSSYTVANRLSAMPGPSGPRPSAFPPPRPVPNVAPPPAPLDDLGSIGGHHRVSLSNKITPGSPLNRAGGSGSASSRSEFVQRAGRYSVGPAGPPPTAALPPTPFIMADPDVNTSSTDRYSQAPPWSSLGSFSSNGHSNVTSTLFTIPASPAAGKLPPDSNLPLPAMAPLPIRPLPPTPGLFSANDADRLPVSPDALSATSNRSSRSNSGLPFARMSSFKLRLRMMSSPTPVTGGDDNRTQSLVSIPPAQPPPNFPLPDIPYHSRQTRSQSQSQVIGYPDTSGMNDQSQIPAHRHSFSPSPPITPLGEAITSRLETYPVNGGASSGQMSPGINGMPSTSSSSAANSPAGTVSFGSRALRGVIPPTLPPDMTPLSPPPRRSSRTSKDLTPSERERWKVVVADLKDEENGKAPVVTPYESVPATLSAINLPSFAD